MPYFSNLHYFITQCPYGKFVGMFTKIIINRLLQYIHLAQYNIIIR